MGVSQLGYMSSSNGVHLQSVCERWKIRTQKELFQPPQRETGVYTIQLLYIGIN